mgnify:CR=1 FL=1
MNNENKLDVLLPLKAYVLGSRLKRHHKDINGVLDIVKEAINRCGDDKDFYKRKAFYYLLECEITRKLDLDSSIENRIAVKKYCEDRELTTLYNNYMKIVEGNTIRKKIHTGDITASFIGHLVDFNGDGDNLHLNSLGFENTEFSEKDWNFLLNTTLKEIIDEHFEGT